MIARPDSSVGSSRWLGYDAVAGARVTNPLRCLDLHAVVHEPIAETHGAQRITASAHRPSARARRVSTKPRAACLARRMAAASANGHGVICSLPHHKYCCDVASVAAVAGLQVLQLAGICK